MQTRCLSVRLWPKCKVCERIDTESWNFKHRQNQILRLGFYALTAKRFSGMFHLIVTPAANSLQYYITVYLRRALQTFLCSNNLRFQIRLMGLLVRETLIPSLSIKYQFPVEPT